MTFPLCNHYHWREVAHCSITALHVKVQFSTEWRRARKTALFCCVTLSVDVAFSTYVNRTAGSWSFDCVEHLTCFDSRLTAPPAIRGWKPSTEQLWGRKCKGIMFTGLFTVRALCYCNYHVDAQFWTMMATQPLSFQAHRFPICASCCCIISVVSQRELV